MVWRKSQRWESTRWNGRGGSEEAHLARLGVLLWRKVGIEAETVRMRVLFLPGQVSPHRAPSAAARDNWYPTLNICLKMQALFVRRICFFHLPEVFNSSYSMITYWNWHNSQPCIKHRDLSLVLRVIWTSVSERVVLKSPSIIMGLYIFPFNCISFVSCILKFCW